MSPSDELELVVVPGGSFCALVLAVPDFDRPPLECLGALVASKTSWIIFQSPSCVLFQSLNA
jgi:hypothetical protein